MSKNVFRPPSWSKLPKSVFLKFFFSPNVLEWHNSARKLKKNLKKIFLPLPTSGLDTFWPVTVPHFWSLIPRAHIFVPSPLHLLRVKIFFTNFFNFLAELCHSKTFSKKKMFFNIFSKNHFWQFWPWRRPQIVFAHLCKVVQRQKSLREGGLRF